MPELPEVETIARNLCLGDSTGWKLPGRTITGVDILWTRSLAEPSPAEFTARLSGQKVIDVGRRGKYLIIYLSQDVLLIHLRMSGDLRLEAVADRTGQLKGSEPHDRIILYLDGGLRLTFNDARKFGRIWLVDNVQSVTAKLGPDPFDSLLTPFVFHQMLISRHRQLKPLLIDQTFLAGIGNIYADESLHRARLHPLVLSYMLGPEQSSDLLSAIRSVLEEGIARNGSSIDWVYRGGDFQNSFHVYQRTGQPCLNCGVNIERILVGQRGTHFCPNCQPKPDVKRS